MLCRGFVRLNGEWPKRSRGSCSASGPKESELHWAAANRWAGAGQRGQPILYSSAPPLKKSMHASVFKLAHPCSCCSCWSASKRTSPSYNWAAQWQVGERCDYTGQSPSVNVWMFVGVWCQVWLRQRLEVFAREDRCLSNITCLTKCLSVWKNSQSEVKNSLYAYCSSFKKTKQKEKKDHIFIF